MLSDNSDGDSSDYQSENMLLEKIQSIEKRVKKLKEIKQDLQGKLEIPIPFSHVVQRLPADSQAEIDHQYDYEVEMMMQKLAGMACISVANRQMVLEVNACVQGHLYEPFYLRISKEQDSSYKVPCYTMPYSIHLREMVDKSSLVNATELIRFLQRVQCCVECYYSRKLQITKAKELCKMFFHSIDYMFVEISFLTRDSSDKFLVTISLIYESDKDIPSSSDIYCRKADPDTLKQMREEFDQELQYFTQMPLDEAITLFKESLNGQSSSGSSSTVLVQRQEEELESEDDESEEDEELEKDDSTWSDLMKGRQQNSKKRLKSSTKSSFPSRIKIGSMTGRRAKRK